MLNLILRCRISVVGVMYVWMLVSVL